MEPSTPFLALNLQIHTFPPQTAHPTTHPPAPNSLPKSDPVPVSHPDSAREPARALAPELTPDSTPDPTPEPAHELTPDSTPELAHVPTHAPNPHPAHHPTHPPTHHANRHPTQAPTHTPNAQSIPFPSPHSANSPSRAPTSSINLTEWPGPPSCPEGLTKSDELQLAHILHHMHALSRPSGFAPTKDEFHRATGISQRAYLRFFGCYSDLVARCGYKTYADKLRLTKLDRRRAMNLPLDPPFIADRTEFAFGDPIRGYELLHAPTNEQGVVMLFGMMAKTLGFLVEVVRTGFPDCEAKRKCEDGLWRRVRIEFEYATSRFNHDPAGCDLIICWNDDAKHLGVEVLELKKFFSAEAQTPAQTPTQTPAETQHQTEPEGPAHAA